MDEQYVLTAMLLGITGLSLALFLWMAATHLHATLAALGIAAVWVGGATLLGIGMVEVIKYGSR